MLRCGGGLERRVRERIVLVHRSDRIVSPCNPDLPRGHWRSATPTVSLTKAAQNQGGIHRLFVVTRLAFLPRVLPRCLLSILRHDTRRAVDPVSPEAMERSDSLVIFIRLRISSVVIDKTEIRLIEIIPFLPLMMTVMAFPIGQSCSRTSPLQCPGSLELSLPPELNEHAGGLGGVGWWFDGRRRHVLP